MHWFTDINLGAVCTEAFAENSAFPHSIQKADAQTQEVVARLAVGAGPARGRASSPALGPCLLWALTGWTGGVPMVTHSRSVFLLVTWLFGSLVQPPSSHSPPSIPDCQTQNITHFPSGPQCLCCTDTSSWKSEGNREQSRSSAEIVSSSSTPPVVPGTPRSAEMLRNQRGEVSRLQPRTQEN